MFEDGMKVQGNNVKVLILFSNKIGKVLNSMEVLLR